MREDEIVRVKDKWKDRVKYVSPLVEGLRCTWKRFYAKKLTYQYPDEKRPVSERWRGLHELVRDEEGHLLCVACGLCAAHCPANAIHLQPYEDQEGNRYPEEFVINELRCIFCGFCEEICPKGAIRMSKCYDYVDYHRENFYFDINKLRDATRFRYQESKTWLRKLLG